MFQRIGQIRRIPDPADTPHPPSAVTFGPDGRTLITADHTGTTRTWRTDAESVANLLCDTTPQPITATDWNHYLPDLP